MRIFYFLSAFSYGELICDYGEMLNTDTQTHGGQMLQISEACLFSGMKPLNGLKFLSCRKATRRACLSTI